MKKFQFKINGKFYEVELINVEDTSSGPVTTISSPEVQQSSPAPVQQQSAPAVTTPAAPITGKAAGAINAPLPGIVRNINVKVGDRIKSGDVVLILEAMKMENNIFSNVDGVVLEIIAISGEPVLEGDKLIVIGE